MEEEECSDYSYVEG